MLWSGGLWEVGGGGGLTTWSLLTHISPSLITPFTHGEVVVNHIHKELYMRKCMYRQQNNDKVGTLQNSKTIYVSASFRQKKSVQDNFITLKGETVRPVKSD